MTRFRFRLVEEADRDLLASWLARDHVAAWWGQADIEKEFFAGAAPAVSHFIALMDERSIGMIQCYRWDDFPEEGNGLGARAGELGMDYLLGEPELMGRGLGPAMLEAFLAQIALTSDGVTGVRTDVAQAQPTLLAMPGEARLHS